MYCLEKKEKWGVILCGTELEKLLRGFSSSSSILQSLILIAKSPWPDAQSGLHMITMEGKLLNLPVT